MLQDAFVRNEFQPAREVAPTTLQPYEECEQDYRSRVLSARVVTWVSHCRMKL